jgi:hypothetical protein
VHDGVPIYLQKLIQIRVAFEANISGILVYEYITRTGIQLSHETHRTYLLRAQGRVPVGLIARGLHTHSCDFNLPQTLVSARHMPGLDVGDCGFAVGARAPDRAVLSMHVTCTLILTCTPVFTDALMLICTSLFYMQILFTCELKLACAPMFTSALMFTCTLLVYCLHAHY